MYHIAPTMLCADLFQMRESMDVLDKLGIDWFHMEILCRILHLVRIF